ncbi:INO80 complex, subunit Ies4 [Sordaria brevicollis]|uniref:INO80 complex, subunit Ies4 n=1 Tax=Sordaria brevicollis TaxID=83679 RepID=A0AAE0PN75_SORBR|nr:INO80 complex, subunit Ies4 [Sordaria brevicollis]
MAPPVKNSATTPKDRRKSNGVGVTVASSNGASSKVVTLSVTPKKLRAIVDPGFVKEDTPVVKEANNDSPADSTVVPAVTNSAAENASDSNANTPAAGTPAPQSGPMGPPADGPKKKGVKRAAGAGVNGNGEPKVRGKPGPKKKQRLEDGTIEGGRGGLAAHKLGPKANMGAINAGLRALDRSGKPCRKWTRGGFTLKSFTGVVWELPRWTAPPKPRPEPTAEEPTPVPASGEGSSKENIPIEQNGQVKSESSNTGVDVEMKNAPIFAADSAAPSPGPTPTPAPAAATPIAV